MLQTITAEVHNQEGPIISPKPVDISKMAITPAALAATHKPASFTRLVTNHETGAKSSEPREGYHAMSGDAPWRQITSTAYFSTIYSTSDAIPEMSNDADVDAHDKLLASGTLGLVNTGSDGAGSVCRAVEFLPAQAAISAAEAAPYMHRTQSLDYGIVVKGEVELLLPSQPPRLMKVGDVAVQRGTNHAWRNASTTEPARIIFVLLAAEKIKFDNIELGEELPDHAGKSKEVFKSNA